MVPIILERDGVTYFLNGKLNQDLVEEFFAKQRGAGSSFDNPSLEQFGHLMMQNYIAGSSSVASLRANVRVRDESPIKTGRSLCLRKGGPRRVFGNKLYRQGHEP
ncbi:hypothetical protein HOLleu_43723 [Holothuria leucospilota]|uniref:Uncharacterized protein n=1 Tax=Holothuria leucospilota TaxID=206669 RepID=A0A9Q0YDF7_HOLLE|nr:hypothetical protein HOLleu_43723 [Holothuria leucospilota]